MTDVEPEINPARIRIGLIIIAVIFVAAVILAIGVHEPFAQAIFVAVAVVCIVRIVLLVRWLRRGGPSVPST